MGPVEPLVLAASAAFFVGALLGGVLFERFFARRALRRIVAQLESLIDRRADAKPIRGLDRATAEALKRVASRLAGVEALATTDQLTGVLNRPTSLRQLAIEVDRAARHDRPIAVALADIDHFKRVNDTYGHQAGDFVLRHVAQLLRTNVRASDIVGRYGGEEFVLVFPDTDEDGAGSSMEKLRRLVGRTPVTLPGGMEVTVTISAGVASGPAREARLDKLTRDADSALYAAKSLGRDQVYLFKALDEGRVVRRASLTPQARDTAMDIGRQAAMAAQDHLVDVLGPRPSWAGRPSDLIAELAVHVANSLGLSDNETLRIRSASLLHDVGKIAIPEATLSKPSELSDAEWRSVMEHPRIGQIVLEQAGAMRDASTIALHHHEWFNGQGYPHGLAGADIPLGARIVAIADAYEAMTSWRPYKRTRTHEEALAELRRCAGTQFDPELVEVFVASFPAQLAETMNAARRTALAG